MKTSDQDTKKSSELMPKSRGGELVSLMSLMIYLMTFSRAGGLAC